MENKKFTLYLYQFLGTVFLSESDKAQQVCDKIKEAIDKGIQIVISFENIKICTYSFLSTAIGQLYGIYDKDLLNEYIEFDGDEDCVLDAKRVVENAIEWFESLRWELSNDV